MNNLKQKLINTGDFIDNEFLDKYIDLVDKNKSRKSESCKTNSHHILPSYYYRHHNLEVDNTPTNRVNLLYRDHMLAHLYLSGCTTGRNRYWNLYSIFMMPGQKYCTDDEIKFLQSLDEYQKLYEEAISAAPNHRKNTHVSEETRKRMKAASKLRAELYENANKGRIWVCNDVEERMIDVNEKQHYINNGFREGRLYKHSPETLDKIKLKTTGQKRSAEFCERMRENAYRTMHFHTQESHKKQGKTLSDFYKTHVNHFKGKSHTEESKQKMRDTLTHKVTINNGEKTIRVMDYNLQKYLDDGWKLGRKSDM